MYDRFEFEIRDVACNATGLVVAALSQGRGQLVYGPSGSGKTHAIRKAVNGALWADVPEVPFCVPRLLADLAAQASCGSEVLHSYESEGHEAAFGRLDDALGDRVVVVDGLDRLVSRPTDNFEDPDAMMLWSDEVEAIRNWFIARVQTRRQILISRRRVSQLDERLSCKQSPPDDWPIKLRWSGDGYLDWESVAGRLDRNPGGLVLAAGSLRLLGVGRLAEWLEETAADGSPTPARELGAILRTEAPTPLTKVLSVLSVAGEARESHLGLLARDSIEIQTGLDLARMLGLVEGRGGMLRVLPYLKAVGAIATPDEVGARRDVKRLCAILLDGVNDISSPDPETARNVLDAHRIQLALGDFQGALSTARFHLSGLISHARSISLRATNGPEYDDARRAYGEIRKMLEAHSREFQPRVRSYVVHYHGYNGYRARSIGLESVALDYRTAIGDWPENALWHARRIALAAERGDDAGAIKFMEQAYQQVPEHGRRDAYLRVRSARWAHHGGALVAAMQLLEGYVSPPEELLNVDVVAYQYLAELEHQWGEPGIGLRRINISDDRLVAFNGLLPVRVHRTDDGWMAETRYPPAHASGVGPWSAVRALGAYMADECLRLVSRPTARLTRQDVGRKGLWLGAINLPESEVGLSFQGSRWLLGTLVGGRFQPSQCELAPIEIACHAPGTERGMFFARVPTDRTGLPGGPVERIVPAGSGNRLEDLLNAMQRLAELDEDVA